MPTQPAVGRLLKLSSASGVDRFNLAARFEAHGGRYRSIFVLQ